MLNTYPGVGQDLNHCLIAGGTRGSPEALTGETKYFAECTQAAQF